MYILDTWSLTLDIWHWYLTWYYLAPDTWHLISDTGTWHAITWHLIPDTWYLTPVLDMLPLYTWYLTLDIWYLTNDMLSLDPWHMLSPSTDTFDWIFWHLTGYYYTWHLYYIAYSWLSLLRGLGMIIILLPEFGTPELMCSWTPVYLNP